MIQTRKIGKLTEIYSTDGYIHRIDEEDYAKRCILLPSLTIADYEEVAEIPPYTKSQYDSKVAEFVRERYTESEEFAIQRKMMNTILSPATISADSKGSPLSEYQAYNAYVEECKARAKDAELYKDATSD